ncbi:MAG: hypothetical protein JW863_01825, partial [Chitinispirillaceae bacterium]|nr:hypothetical protein [Chitinispirillaceae bacterium]
MATATPSPKKRSFPEFINGVSVSTSKKHILKLNPVKAKMLELDDVLYHTNSAVIMPEIPQTAAAAPGNQITGLRAIALGLKQIEFDPRTSVLIAAHTDTEGSAEDNFALSKKRGKGIYTLMTSGRKEDWAYNSSQQHVIEDYQQILKYMFDKHGWTDCDPGPINNTWNASTKKATEAFIDKYNAEMVHGANPPLDAVEIDKRVALYAIEHDWKHKWTIYLWRAVYDIYVNEIMKTLNVDRALLDSRYRSKISFLKNADNEHYLGCGESHPIDKKNKNEYRSQKNRRVEVYFFNRAEMKNAWGHFIKWWITHPCPSFGKKIHGPDICPLWHNLLFKKLPIDEADLTCVGYHLKFNFWERKTNKRLSVPDGLQINAFSDSAEANNLNARVSYMARDGIYLVKVPDDASRTHIHFTFNSIQGTDTSPRWVKITPTARPNYFQKKIVSENEIRTQNGNTSLEDLPFEKQLEYYDLPAQWSSINYHTRYDNNFDTGDTFDVVVQTRKQYKPFGQNITSPTEALVFSLDDIVLLDTATGTQAIRDADHRAGNVNVVPAGVNPPHYPALSNNSRIKIFIADTTSGRLQLYKTGAADATARIPFPSNYIAVKQAEFPRARIVFFRDGFYTIGSRRTRAIAGWQANGFVVGARAAVRNDQRYHQRWLMAWNNPTSPPEYHACGDYELHYFHHLYYINNKPVSYLVKYVSISFMGDTRAGNTVPPWSPDILNFIDSGVYNAMNRWNVKKLYFEERTNTALNVVDPTLIFPFSFFDERETFHVAAANPANHPTNINFENQNQIMPLWSNGELRTAQNNALGGRSRYMAFVCDTTPAQRAFQWEIRTFSASPYSIFALGIADYQDKGSARFEDPEGNFGFLTFAHELGHATGLPDEYVRDGFSIQQQPAAPGGNPVVSTFSSYDQGWEPYETESPDNLSIMQGNRTPKMHHHWYALYFLNTEILLNHHHMDRFFPSTRQFVIKDENRIAYTYTRGVMSRQGTHRRIHQVTPAGVATTREVRLDCQRPMHRTQQFALPGAPTRRLSLSLYDVGQDRSSYEEFYSGQLIEMYQGVLTVRVMIRVRFEGGVNHAHWRTGTNLT